MSKLRPNYYTIEEKERNIQTEIAIRETWFSFNKNKKICQRDWNSRVFIYKSSVQDYWNKLVSVDKYYERVIDTSN